MIIVKSGFSLSLEEIVGRPHLRQIAFYLAYRSEFGFRPELVVGSFSVSKLSVKLYLKKNVMGNITDLLSKHK